MNKFEQASSDGHQMSLVGVCGWGSLLSCPGGFIPGLISDEGQLCRGCVYSGHMGTSRCTDTHL